MVPKKQLLFLGCYRVGFFKCLKKNVRLCCSSHKQWVSSIKFSKCIAWPWVEHVDSDGSASLGKCWRNEELSLRRRAYSWHLLGTIPDQTTSQVKSGCSIEKASCGLVKQSWGVRKKWALQTSGYPEAKLLCGPLLAVWMNISLSWTFSRCLIKAYSWVSNKPLFPSLPKDLISQNLQDFLDIFTALSRFVQRLLR